jgi:tRNA pseudouridine38-40 synthase
MRQAAGERGRSRPGSFTRMPVVKLILEYDGTRYAGWQVQPNGLAIQEVVERALATLHKAPRRVTGAGRTDAGVHARGQVASFAEDRPLPRAAYVKGMNALLPDDVAVRAASVEPDGFDARRSARGKRYRYRILNDGGRAPLSRLYAWQVFRALDVDAMRAAAAPLVGRHDFASFQASDCAAHHAVRELRRLDVLADGGGIDVVVEATAFVKHMVRNIVGTLVEVGVGRRAPASMPALLARRDRTAAGCTAPAHGLVLEEVFYDLTPKTSDVASRDSERALASLAAPEAAKQTMSTPDTGRT